jgi:hypothetical protein
MNDRGEGGEDPDEDVTDPAELSHSSVEGHLWISASSALTAAPRVPPLLPASSWRESG